VSGISEKSSLLLTKPITLWIAGILHATLGITLSVLLWHNLHMFIWDIGGFDHVVWNTSQWRWYASSIEVDIFLGDHFTPILAVFGLLHHLIPSPYCLIIVQQIGFSLSGVMVAFFIRQNGGSVWLGWAAAILLWCHISSYGITINDFHIISLVLPLTIGLYWLARTARYKGVLLVGFLLLMVREDAGIAMASVGIVFLFERQRRRMGLLLLLTGCAWTVLANWVFMPMFRGGETSDAMIFMHTPSSEGGLGAFITNILLGSQQWRFIYSVLLAVMFLPLLTKWRLVALFFSLSHMLVITKALDIRQHYASIPLAITAILLLIVFCDVWRSEKITPRLKRCLCVWVILAVTYSFGRFMWIDVRMRLWIFRQEPRVAHFDTVAAQLPPEAHVAASQTVGSRIAHRQHLYLWPEIEYYDNMQTPEPLENAEYIFTDFHRENAHQRTKCIQALRDNPQWQLVIESGDFALFRHQPTAD